MTLLFCSIIIYLYCLAKNEFLPELRNLVIVMDSLTRILGVSETAHFFTKRDFSKQQ